MDKIHQLDSVVADQIAAGEVVQRPASAVKELLENAVDAKASDITLVLGNNGSALIRVVDNGCGMSPSDAKRSFLRHATSKIKCSADLFALHTFGFRGEALASIASVSHVEMITRRAEDELAVKLTVHGGEVISQEFVAAAVGTSIAVENLFYNVPARRRFLKEGNAERRAIISELEHVALVNENVSFSFATLESGSQIIFRATSLRQRVEDVAGKRLSKKLLPIDLQTNIVSLGGWISTHEGALSTSRGANFFVNGRFMRSLSLQKAVTMGYGRLLDAGKYPQFYIYINVDPTSIDVNVHPTKTEIKFENENEIWQILQSTVRRTLGRDNIVPQMDFDNPTPIEIPIYSASNTNVRQPTTGARMNYNPFENQVWESVSDKEPLIEENLPDELFEMTSIDKGSEPSQAALPMEVAIDFSVFQFSTRYLCTTTVDGLVLVDYTRAIERIEYERLINTLQQGTTPSQMEL
ncbi:MAG: DNA mismatch repair endonuclease MutL, partial [Mucinivorans sp.]